MPLQAWQGAQVWGIAKRTHVKEGNTPKNQEAQTLFLSLKVSLYRCILNKYHHSSDENEYNINQQLITRKITLKHLSGFDPSKVKSYLPKYSFMNLTLDREQISFSSFNLILLL